MLRRIYITVIISLAAIFTAKADGTKNASENESNISKNILIICSYNPDMPTTATAISDFYIIHQRRKSSYNMIVESIYCNNVADLVEWKGRMYNVLGKYFSDGQVPAAIILLGTEASSVYFSLDKEAFDGNLLKVPLFIGMRGRNIILMPDNEEDDIRNWYPECLDILEDFKDYNIAGGKLLEYNAGKNINLIHKIYPDIKKLLFISDNTFGGITMQALVRKEAAKNKKLEIQYCDGRHVSLVEVKQKIANIDDHDTGILVGTWRIDCSGNYVLSSTMTSLATANPKVPVFSLSSTGMMYTENENWAIGGYAPEYIPTGKSLANDCLNYLENDSACKPAVLPSKYQFDYNKLQAFHIPTHLLPKDAVIKNKPVSFFEQHAAITYTALCVFFIIIISLITISYYLHRAKTLNSKLTTLNEELTKAKEHAEEANRMKTSFLANMSHEIRTPLNAIVGFSSLITSSDIELPDEEKKEMTELINTNSDILLKLINDILDISRIESGKTSFAFNNADIISLCKNVLSTAKHNRKYENTVYQLDIKVDKLTMYTDSGRLQQVLTNLLSNAAKCTPEGFIRLSLEVNEKERMAVFSVTDTGCGIPKEQAEKIFERFEKLDIFKQGAGLGLSICRTIIEKFGGRIWVDTEYTGGARFVFTHSLDLTEAGDRATPDKA